jgi:hypothetical protein
LHAYLLGFEHPLETGYLEFRSELPADLEALRRGLRDAQGGLAPETSRAAKKRSKASKP